MFGLTADLSKDPVLCGFWHILDFNWGNPSENRDNCDTVHFDDLHDVPSGSDTESSDVPNEASESYPTEVPESHRTDEYMALESAAFVEPADPSPENPIYPTQDLPADPDLKSEMPCPAADVPQPAEDLEAKKRQKLLDNIRGLRMGTMKKLG